MNVSSVGVSLEKAPRASPPPLRSLAASLSPTRVSAFSRVAVASRSVETAHAALAADRSRRDFDADELAISASAGDEIAISSAPGDASARCACVGDEACASGAGEDGWPPLERLRLRPLLDQAARRRGHIVLKVRVLGFEEL